MKGSEHVLLFCTVIMAERDVRNIPGQAGDIPYAGKAPCCRPRLMWRWYSLLNFFCHFISEWSPVALQLVAARQHFYYNREIL